MARIGLAVWIISVARFIGSVLLETADRCCEHMLGTRASRAAVRRAR